MAIPTTLAELAPWMLDHADQWKSHNVALGIGTQQAAAFDTAAKSFNAAYAEAIKLKQQSKNATEAQNDALREAKRLMGGCIETIRAFARNSANPAAVYTLAEIDAPTPPTPVGPPNPVTDIRVGIALVSGALNLSWKASNPATGVTYIIARKLPNQSAFTFLGVAPGSGPGAKTFTDATLPAGSDFVSYSIQGSRSGVVGVAVAVTVNFGVVGGQQVANLVSGPSKLAA